MASLRLALEGYSALCEMHQPKTRSDDNSSEILILILKGKSLENEDDVGCTGIHTKDSALFPL